MDKRPINWRRVALWTFLLPTLVVIATTALLVWDGLTDEVTPSDVAVVLGNRVEPSGVPSARLAGRLDRAVELYRAGVAPVIITSGGLGVEGHDEAVVMRDYLVAHGVPPERVIVDSEGINSAATARNAARIMKERGWRSATVVSQYHHITRCKLAFHQAGLSPVYGAHTSYREFRDYLSLMREVVGIWVYLVTNKGGG